LPVDLPVANFDALAGLSGLTLPPDPTLLDRLQIKTLLRIRPDLAGLQIPMHE
jgi:hypothetical protein